MTHPPPDEVEVERVAALLDAAWSGTRPSINAAKAVLTDLSSRLAREREEATPVLEWKFVAEGLDRIDVPGGYLYRSFERQENGLWHYSAPTFVAGVSVVP